MTRLFSLVLIAAVIGPMSPGGLLFRCKLDGQVRPACCCEHARPKSAPEDHASVHAKPGGCCDVLLRAPSQREATNVDPSARLAQVQVIAVVLPQVSPVPSLVWSPATTAFWTGPPRPGGPLFRQHRSLLI